MNASKAALEYDDSKNPMKGPIGERLTEDPVWDIAVEISCGTSKEGSRNRDYPDFDEVWDRMVEERKQLPPGATAWIPAE